MYNSQQQNCNVHCAGGIFYMQKTHYTDALIGWYLQQQKSSNINLSDPTT